MRIRDDKVELRITLDPQIYSSIVSYLSTEDGREISSFIEEVVLSYVEMHSHLYEESLENDDGK